MKHRTGMLFWNVGSVLPIFGA